MTVEKGKRENLAPLGVARQRDIARRARVGVHKNRATSDVGSFVNEQMSELLPFEHNLQAQYMTKEGSNYVAQAQLPFLRRCLVSDEILPWNTPNLPFLPPITPILTSQWELYRLPNFMEAGKIVQLTLKATYNTGKNLWTSHFMLLRRHPLDNLFTQEDIILDAPIISLTPQQTGNGWGGNWATWYDKKLDVNFNYDFPRSFGQATPGAAINQELAVDYSLYILTEDWRLAATDELRVELLVEDRGR